MSENNKRVAEQISAAALQANVIDLTLPFPPEELQPNTHVDRRVKARTAKAYKRGCWLLVRSEMVRQGLTGPLKEPVRAEIVFVVFNLRRDTDNCVAAFKSGLDGIVATGLLRSDDARSLTIAPSVIRGAKQEIRVRLRGAG